MGWRFVVWLCFFVAQGDAAVQYINTRFKGNCPCQNVPIQQTLPARLPLSANLPIRNNWVANLPQNSGISLPNTCPCKNSAPILNQPLSPQEKSILIAKLKSFISNLIPIAEQLALLSNLALETKKRAANLNMPMRKLNVPIVNDVPFGALRVARNLPMSNFLAENSQILTNNILLGKGPINYENVAGMPLNNVARMALSNLRNVPLNTLINGVPNSNIKNVPLYNNLNGVSNIPFNPIVNNVINKNIERQLLLNRPPCNNFPLPNNNVPCNNVPSMALTNLLEKMRIANNLNLPVNNLGMPINNQNLNLPVNLAVPRNIQNFRVNTVPNPFINNLPVQKPVRYINSGAPPILNNRFFEPLGSSSNSRVTNVPVIPYNSLANLPAYNGMPVIKVSESVYKLIPDEIVL
ncbi:hypothetical protein O0L34_g14558 [Tuta absoluta]|nr:hypothetical protein O0L34_g14558 [Tuta absoluta]